MLISIVSMVYHFGLVLQKPNRNFNLTPTVCVQVSLAVGDAKEVIENAELKKLILQVSIQ